MSSLLPAPKEVRDLFEDLLGRSITVNVTDPLVGGDLNAMLVSLYTDSHTKLCAVVGMDLPLTVYAGSAIGLLPVKGAQECVDRGYITEIIAENVREVCNIMTTLFNRDGGPHLKFYQASMPDERPPGDAASLLLALGNRLDLTVDVAGYGSGRWSVSLAE